MKQFIRPAAAMLMIAAIASTSCKKNDDLSSRKGMLVGIWNMVKTGADVNKNGKLEDGEVAALPAGTSNKLQIKNDGTGVLSATDTLSIDLNFSWSLIDDNQSIRMIMIGDTSVLKIVSMNSSNLTTLESSQKGVQGKWSVYAKQ